MEVGGGGVTGGGGGEVWWVEETEEEEARRREALRHATKSERTDLRPDLGVSQKGASNDERTISKLARENRKPNCDYCLMHPLAGGLPGFGQISAS